MSNKSNLTNVSTQEFNERLDEMMYAHRRYNIHFSFVMISIDTVKSSFDKVIRITSEEITKLSRPTDYIFKTSENIFSILLTHTKQDHAVVYAEKIKKLIAEDTEALVDDEVEINISVTEALSNDDNDSIILRATELVNEAKAKEGNVVVSNNYSSDPIVDFEKLKEILVMEELMEKVPKLFYDQYNDFEMKIEKLQENSQEFDKYLNGLKAATKSIIANRVVEFITIIEKSDSVKKQVLVQELKSLMDQLLFEIEIHINSQKK